VKHGWSNNGRWGTDGGRKSRRSTPPEVHSNFLALVATMLACVITYSGLEAWARLTCQLEMYVGKRLSAFANVFNKLNGSCVPIGARQTVSWLGGKRGQGRTGSLCEFALETAL